MFQWNSESKPILRSVICSAPVYHSIFDAASQHPPYFFFLLPFTACIQPFLLIFYSNDIKAFLSESVKRCFNARLVFCTFGYLPVEQDINKWCVVDASLKNPFSITSIHNCHWIKCASVCICTASQI